MTSAPTPATNPPLTAPSDLVDRLAQVLPIPLWFDPLSRLRVFIWWLVLLGVPAMALLGGASYVVAAMRFHDTYTLSASMRYLPVSQSVQVDESVQSYQLREFTPQEVLSWFYQQQVYEELYPISDRDDGVQVLRSLISIGHNRDAGIYYVTYTGAYDRDRAAETLNALMSLMEREARTRAASSASHDRAVLQAQLDTVVEDHRRLREALIAFARETGVVDMDQAILADSRQIVDLEERLAARRIELTDLRQRRERLPELIASIPHEIAAGRSTRSTTDEHLAEARAREQALAARYTDEHPLVIAAREQRAALEAQLAREASQPTQADHTMRNPVLNLLEEEQVLLELAEPRAVTAIAALEEQRSALRARLAQYPIVQDEYQRLVTRIAYARRMEARLQARITEIDMALELSRGQLVAFEAPVPARADVKPRTMKLAVVTGAGAAGGLGLVVAWLLAWCLLDPRPWSAADARIAWRAPAVEVCQRADRAWRRRAAERLVRAGSPALVIAPPDDGTVHGVAAQLAVGESRVLIVGGAGDGAGVGGVLARAARPEDVVIRVDAADVLPWGVIDDVLDRLPTGRLEAFLRETATRYDVVLIVLPVADEALVQRLAGVVASALVIDQPRWRAHAQARPLLLRQGLAVHQVLWKGTRR